MSVFENDFAAALRDHDLIGNPKRAQEFFALVEESQATHAAQQKRRTSRRRTSRLGVLVGVVVYLLAFIVRTLPGDGIADPAVSGVITISLIIGGTAVIVIVLRPATVGPADYVSSKRIDPDVALPGGWLEELPSEQIETLTAQTRWDAADFMTKITEAGIPEVGTDYDDPTFEERFSQARRERTIAMLNERR